MDFISRDRYRHAVEGIAKRCPHSEIEVAEAVVSHCLGALSHDPADALSSHVGYHLVSGGRYRLEESIGYRPHARERLYRGPLAARGLIYWGLLAALTVLLAAACGASMFAVTHTLWIAAVMAALAVVPTSDVALTITNRIAAWLWPARTLPKIDYRQPVASAHRTMTVYTALLTSPKAAQHVIDNMEIGYLANSDPNVRFAILADLKAAPEQSTPADSAILDAARRGVAVLNDRYGLPDERPFSLFVRGRTWSERDRVWMGWERKRGALTEFCSIIRGATDTSFTVVDGDTSVLPGVTFVITLDTDTVLPRDGARKLISTIAHPLNRAHLDPTTRTVRRGYGLVQPRVSMSLEGSTDSLFAWLYSGTTGVDPYAGAVSDTYQDVFGEGSFTGKGIFEVDIFNASLGDRFCENTLLSHDLLEGSYLRTALASDVEVLDDQPASYISHCARLHRWVRGDWQTLPWLAPRVPTPSGHERNPLTTLHRWKIIDNLRRSLYAPVTVLFATAGFALLPSEHWVWLAIVLALLLFPLYFGLADSLLFRRPPADTRSDHTTFMADLRRDLLRSALNVAVMPHQAYLMTDAIARALWRMTISRRNLLEWETAAETERRIGTTGLSAFVSRMWPASAVTLLAVAPIALGAGGFAAALAAAPLLAIWLTAPVAAWRASRPVEAPESEITPEDTATMRRLSLQTWRFFTTFVTPDDHYLAPDNYQEDPKDEVAHRTSPTNMGLQLLSYVTAYDLGYLTIAGLVESVSRTLNTLAGMERFRGHFYNWYDTLTLQPLRPTYVSTVDSGNLAGHLVTLRVAMLEISERPLLDSATLDGIADAARLALEDVQAARAAVRDVAALSEVRTALEEVVRRVSLDTPPENLGEWLAAIEGLSALTRDLPGRMGHLGASDEHQADLENARASVRDAAAAVSAPLDLISTLAPWAREVLAASGTHAGRPDPELAPLLTFVPSLVGLAEGLDGALIALDAMAEAGGADSAWAARTAAGVRAGRTPALTLLAELRLGADIAREMWEHTDFAMLFDESRLLFSIGFNTAEGRLDDSYYDMLASECRLASFLAIAKGETPQEHWFRLGRAITRTEGGTALVSWSASMFEYLMPLLVMPSYDNTLLDQTCKAAVARQIEYGSQCGVPWGISESGYNMVDVHLNYQYRAFGVPGLGLKRGLADDLVVSPYASVLALMVAPEPACQNLQRLTDSGMLGRFGCFEAIDYTPSRQRRGQSSTVIRSYMAHHQGMSLLALAYALCDRPMQRRFGAERQFQAVMLLLQERIPKSSALFTHTDELLGTRVPSASADIPIRVIDSPDTPYPEVQLLSNGRYAVMVTNAGGGYSRWKNLAVTRWREDATCDRWGTYCYIREVASGQFWSTAHQPTLKRATSYEAIFSEGRAEFRRRDKLRSGDGAIDTYTEIVVSPEDDIELRRVCITNRSRQRRVIDVTSYAEVVIAPAAADEMHPAFSNLFVQTEIISERHAILCSRRPRSADEPVPSMFHLMVVHGTPPRAVSYETDRSRFIGRTRSVIDPQALRDPGALSGTAGAVLDPMVAIRYELTLEPEQAVMLDMVFGIADSRDIALSLLEKYQDKHLADRVFDLVLTHSQVALQQINASEADAQVYARLASSLIYANTSLRAAAAVIGANRRGQSGLWGYAISGDLPIVLLQIRDAANIDFVRQLVQAHAYWRLKGLAVDLVIWNEDHAGYRQRLQEQIMGMIASGAEASLIDHPGGIFVRQAEQISIEDRILFQSVARVLIADSRGTLAEQLERRSLPELRVPLHVPVRPYKEVPTPNTDAVLRSDLILANGLGGFSADGREYVIVLGPGQTTPAPWANVLANPRFGTIVSESGSAYTWGENAHEFRLTPWHNDPVSDAGGEAIYLRDEESGHVWSPTPLPAGGAVPCVIRHGFGYSVFESTVVGIRTELWVYVALDADIKFSVLKVRNESAHLRKISVTGYVEWVLGDVRGKSAMHITTEIEPQSGALMARNAYSQEFAERVAFFDVDDPKRTLTGDRREFIGRNGSLRRPDALQRVRLSGKVGAGLDPCAALQVGTELLPGQERQIIFRLGVGSNAEEAARLVSRYRGTGGTSGILAARNALDAVRAYWQQLLGAVRIETPDPAVDVMANGWLVYQTLACRLWARSGYYQSGGAFGFRDQLQDTMALVHAEPGQVRAHLLLCASRQFLEGDAQHWWHPPSGRGVRTRCSDDYLWLPLAVCRYVLSTADTGVLEERVPFLEGRPVNPEDDSYYDLPGRAGESATLYEHCVRAIRHGLRFGAHGLPLIGSGDWNDGMNLVGIRGKGESVWLGFFLCDVLSQFATVADSHGDPAFAAACRDEAEQLGQRIEANGWDGDWYRRAYFDDGTPLGSSTNVECRIDSISQSWSVLSGAGDPARARWAMRSLDERLIRRDVALVQLLDPPFDQAIVDPGYIRGYVPGVRENGGQYTHGAIWAAMAFAALDDRVRAWEVLRMINPVNHALSAASVATYKVEPYVVAADVYAVTPHTGRGGWSWYTGSAGWMYRLILESLLGLRREGTTLHFVPCLPAEWTTFTIHYRYHETPYRIVVSQTHDLDSEQPEKTLLSVDGVAMPDGRVLLVNDLREHAVEVSRHVH
ncbi:MAG: glucoamylase family protein [Rhodocyclaceae bacterium]|nr:glucoamylase family protein [Rhodocyclaceae bacterium]